MTTTALEALAQSTEHDPPDEPETPQQPPEETPEQLIARGVIPDGYTRDPNTKEIRPKKRGGRPRRGTPPPAPDTPIDRSTGDEPPNSKAKGKVRQSIPRYQKGVIAAGMTKLYKRAGRIIKAMDRDIGIAVVESAEDCGEAWDELARTNPRVRAVLMKLISGGAWGAVLMAHLPILLAIVMKDGIRKHIPFVKLLEGAMAPDEDGPSEISKMLGGMSQEDMQQVMSLGMQLMGQTAGKVTPNGTE